MPKSSGKQSRSPSPASKSRADPDIDLKLDKIKITPFSESKDWESTVFELKLLLRQAWKDPSLDIIKYLTDERYATNESSSPAAAKANQLIYYILSVGSVRGSFARNAIIAAQSSTAQPHIKDNEGLELFNYFNNTFIATEDHKTSLPSAQKSFHSLRQKAKESASDFIARTDLAVSTLTKLGEPVSDNTWIFALANGLKAEFDDTRKGVLFGRPGYDTVIDVKKSIINEEIVLATMKDNGKDTTKDAKDKDSTAFVAKDHSGLSCHYCGIKGHIQPDCRKKKRDEQHRQTSTNKKGHGGKGKGKPSNKGKKGKGKPSNNHNNRHSYDGWNSSPGHDGQWHQSNKGQWHTHDKGSWTSTIKGKDSKGKHKGRGRGWSHGNFPSDYSGSYANINQDSLSANDNFDTSSQSQWSDQWVDGHDLGMVVLHNEDENKMDLDSHNGEFYDIFDRTHALISPATAIPQLPHYTFEHQIHPEVGHRVDLPPIFQIHIHYEPFYAPFPVMVRSDMTISDVLINLSHLLQTKRVFFFLFHDYRLCTHSQRLHDVPGIVPSSTLLLVHWDVEQALRFHSLYNKLNAQDTLDLYWNFANWTFQTQHPAPDRRQRPIPATLAHPTSPVPTVEYNDSPTTPQQEGAVIVEASPVSPAISFAFASIHSISNALQSSSITPTKYYAIRRGRYPSPTIVESWEACKQLVYGFPHAEYKSFRNFHEATEYLDLRDIAFVCLHADDTLHLPETPPPVEGGRIIFKSTLRPEAPEWKATKNLQLLGPSSNDKKTETAKGKSSILGNNTTKSKTPNSVNYQFDKNVGSQNSLAFPAFDSPPRPRNGGYLFFEDGKDHEDYPSGTALIATARDDLAFPFMDGQSSSTILRQVREQKQRVQELEDAGVEGQWMFFDSGASRTVIRTESPLRSHLTKVVPSNGSCTIGNGTRLPYIETGTLTANNQATVVEGLEFDLYSAVAAAKRGISAIIDYDPISGENRSFIYCKDSGAISPLMERRHGALEVPIHLTLSRKDTVGLIAKENESPRYGTKAPNTPQTTPSPAKLPSSSLPPPNGKAPVNVTSKRLISAFWRSFDLNDLSLACREQNKDALSLFTYDIVQTLNQRDKDFLLHARLAHLPSKKILQLIHNGNTGLPFSGKLLDLCRPCMESRQRAQPHGKEKNRHPNGKIGEHLHSDLAIVNIPDYGGYKYVLTVVDEISDEVVAALLKEKTAETVLSACQRIHAIITSRATSKVKTWQFDRGSEFLNKLFDEWIHEKLGAKQLFSNVEHPWENGRAERSFQTIFMKARSLMKFADLPIGTWGRAVMHAVFLKNRSPSSRLNGISPLHFRTGKPFDFTSLRLFGSPAQIFIRPSLRSSNKFSDRSEHGTFLGMSTKGNGYIFRVDRNHTIVEVDSKDVKFNETFSDIRDRKGRLIRRGVVLPPDLHTTQEPIEPESAESDLPSQDGIIAPTKRSPILTSNRYQALSDPVDSSPDDSPSDTHGLKEPTSAPDQSQEPSIPKATKYWKYVPEGAPTGTGDRKNDGPKSVSFFQVPPAIQGPERRSTRINTQATIKPTTPATVLPAMATSPEKYNDELDTLLSCLESKIPPDLCLMSSPRTSALHATFQGDIDGRDPKSQREIDRLPPEEAKRYNDATRAEFNGMKKKQVMELVPASSIPSATQIYPSVVNWTTKKVLGIYSKTKCRICFGGHRYDKTYTDCFAPTVNFTTVLMILCIGTMFGWTFGSLDYSQAYLNADIDELCYMRAPESLREYDHKGDELYWRLKKVIYGHPKGSRLWADCLHKKLQQLGFTQFKTDQCAYAKWDNWNTSRIGADSTITIILVHSDDLILASNNHDNLQNIKIQLLQAFEGVDQGDLTSFCGVEINSTPTSLELSMDYYWDKLLTKFDISDSDLQDTPLKAKILRSECPATPDKARQREYLQIIGSIIYGYTHCRLDLAHAVNMFTRVMHSPSANHLVQLRNFLKYINKTKASRMTYHKDPSVYYGMDFTFFGNVDSSHADDPDTMRSTGGWFFFLRPGQGCVAAKSGQTPDVALSSTESETIWACSAATQGAYMKQLLDETRIFNRVTFELHEDSQPAINAQKRNVSQSKFRHIKTKYYYIRQLIYDGWVKMVKVDTKDQVADMTTKILPASIVKRFTDIVLGNYSRTSNQS